MCSARAHNPGLRYTQIVAGGNGEVTIAREVRVRSELANEKLMHNFVTAAAVEAARHDLFTSPK